MLGLGVGRTTHPLKLPCYETRYVNKPTGKRRLMSDILNEHQVIVVRLEETEFFEFAVEACSVA
ncbi:hypothetical protein CWI37_2535p0010 [Hamiltosporidium tvaerminnensis]|uniref:Uncharacterized protein n=1 Tax=Hamiltosporidium tvaerminnensis TaxID=1176355 RepID=A0A4Q9KQW9_9MICR|nr:hypothetical protein CWI37_2535p0010 [Hamiltosporidium tvaerminnensis]